MGGGMSAFVAGFVGEVGWEASKGGRKGLWLGL